jgi:hypothetical protein
VEFLLQLCLLLEQKVVPCVPYFRLVRVLLRLTILPDSTTFPLDFGLLG